jgi:creatinine amidohydrolase/Fe(II)-dependent formamide hydrolase-like protein
MAYGLTEPHGGFNALGLDWLKACALVERVAQQRGGIVAPPVAWHVQDIPEFHDDGKGHGCSCESGIKQSLCSSIPVDLFLRMLLFQIRAFDARGFKVGIFVTGHGGGIEVAMRKVGEYYLHRTGSPIRLHVIADAECIDRDLPYRGDHAGMCETSQMMALYPALVDLTRPTTGIAELGERFAGGINFAKGPLPTAEIGRKIVESQIRNLGSTATRLLAEHRPRTGWTAPDLNETETIWADFDRMTRKYWTVTYEEYKSGTSDYGKYPAWEVLEG